MGTSGIADAETESPSTQEQRFRVIAATHLLLEKANNELLLLRRFNTGYEDGDYSLVAGHLDGQETCTQATIREAKEEVGIVVSPKDAEVVHVMHRRIRDEERIDFFVVARKWRGVPAIMEPAKCDDLRWVEFDNLPSNTVPYVKRAIESIRKGVAYSEYGWQSAARTFVLLDQKRNSIPRGRVGERTQSRNPVAIRHSFKRG